MSEVEGSVLRSPRQEATSAVPRILVVEDDPATVELVSDVLELGSCEVLVARTGEEGLSVLVQETQAQRPVDLILLDVMIPEMDGYEVITRVKADPRVSNTSIILTTAVDSVSSKTLGLGLGADDYITKPFDPHELLARIDAVLRIRRTDEALRSKNAVLSALIEIGHVVTSSLDVAEVLDAAAREISRIVPAEAGVLVLADDQAGELVVRATFGLGGGWPSGHVVPTGQGIVGHVVETGQPRLVDNVERDARFLDSVDEPSSMVALSVLCVPVVSHEKTVGAIEVASRQAGAFTLEDQETLLAVAGWVAVALENAGLYGELEGFARELERSQAQLVQAEKVAAMGRLVASIAHEINNPLQAIHNSLHLTLSAGLGPDKRQSYVRMAQAEVERLMTIARSMLDFCRPSRGKSIPTDLNQIVQSVLSLADKRLQQGGVHVQTLLAQDLPRVLAVPDQIGQVFLNIVINAVEAMSSGGRLEVSTGPAGDGEWIEAWFRDDGPGIPEDRLDRVFEPFYTTKKDGTGLGLAISYGIIERHGGMMELRSRAGEGAAFVVRLPTRRRGLALDSAGE
jgi:signal transduction histidine kinase